MCGIAGSIGRHLPSADRIKATLHALKHRGPDAEGWITASLPNAQISLLHLRLSIIDLDQRANQPFERDNYTLVYNGEIYNFDDVRHELEQLGQRFETTSDTEVLLRAWQHWGQAMFPRLEGMWAFAILDKSTGQLTLCRDRFGEKPLFLWPRNGTLYFSSEVKGLASLAGEWPTPNKKQVLRYLTNGYKALYKSGDTFFDGVIEMPPGTLLTLTDATLKRPEFFWQLRYQPKPMSLEDAQDRTKELLERAAVLRLKSDVPLAFCLSGGIDSSYLSSIANRETSDRIHCFSIIDTDERYDESENITAMVRALGCDHTKIPTSHENFFHRLNDLVAFHDAPVATISYYVHAQLSEAIQSAGYKVAISGSGADEIFTGYYDHYLFWLASMWRRSQMDPGVDFETLLRDWKSGQGRFIQNPRLQDPMVFVKNAQDRSHIYLDQTLFEDLLVRPFHEEFDEAHFTDETLRNRMMNELFAESVPVLLHEDDKNSMRCSIENRSPFLDRKLAEFLFTVPSEYLIGGGATKQLLRNASKTLLPEQVRLDKRKRGFNASILSLVDIKDSETRDRLLSDGPIFELIDRKRLEGFLENDMQSNSLSKFLFSFVSARTFLDHCHNRRMS